MLTERRVRAADIELNLAVGPPSGPPLLLLHGVTRCWQDYVPLLPGLTTRWQVHALDLRGHGQSGRRAPHYRAADHAGDTVALLRELGKPVVIYGHSLGALVAVAAAAAEPERVHAIILEDVPGPGLLTRLHETPFHTLFVGIRELARRGGSVEVLTRALANLPLSTTGPPVRLGDLRDGTSLRFTARCLRMIDPEVLTPIIEQRLVTAEELRAQLRQVRCPALLLRADEAFGGMLPRAEAAEFIGLLRECITIDRPGVGHLIHWLEPDATLRFVLGFLESL
jgi:pimeloyl-ACP methyl ester carboxylesterase